MCDESCCGKNISPEDKERCDLTGVDYIWGCDLWNAQTRLVEKGLNKEESLELIRLVVKATGYKGDPERIPLLLVEALNKKHPEEINSEYFNCKKCGVILTWETGNFHENPCPSCGVKNPHEKKT